MTRRALLVLGAIVFSMTASAVLGRLALPLSPFGHMLKQMGHGATNTATYGDPLKATMRMLRLTTFVLDPLVAALTGLLVGLFRDKKSATLAGVGILPLSAFSAIAYPVLWVGLIGGVVDMLVASGAASLTWRLLGRDRSGSATTR